MLYSFELNNRHQVDITVTSVANSVSIITSATTSENQTTAQLTFWKHTFHFLSTQSMVVDKLGQSLSYASLLEAGQTFNLTASLSREKNSPRRSNNTSINHRNFCNGLVSSLKPDIGTSLSRFDYFDNFGGVLIILSGARAN